MARGGSFFLFITLVLFTCADSGAEVRVRLYQGLRAVDISGLDLRLSSAVAPGLGFSKIHIVRLGPQIWQVSWNRESEDQILRAPTLRVRGQMMHVGFEPQPDDLEVVPGRRGLSVIGRLELNDYLRGVLPAEMPTSWPLEALKAQAVAARSFVLKQMVEHQTAAFDVDSSIADQVYHFASTRGAAKVERSLNETAQEVLADGDGHVVKAYYSADCGCQSEDPHFVWGGLEPFTSVKDPTCVRRAPLNWSLTLPKSEIEAKLLAALSLPAISNIKALQIRGRTPSGRVAGIDLVTQLRGQTSSVTLSAQEFRRIVGFRKVQSADFSMHWNLSQLEITGRGAGHGVGLCQRGARTLAEEGHDYRQILKLYYPRAHLQSRGNFE